MRVKRWCGGLDPPTRLLSVVRFTTFELTARVLTHLRNPDVIRDTERLKIYMSRITGVLHLREGRKTRRTISSPSLKWRNRRVFRERPGCTSRDLPSGIKRVYLQITRGFRGVKHGYARLTAAEYISVYLLPAAYAIGRFIAFLRQRRMRNCDSERRAGIGAGRCLLFGASFEFRARGACKSLARRRLPEGVDWILSRVSLSSRRDTFFREIKGNCAASACVFSAFIISLADFSETRASRFSNKIWSHTAARNCKTAAVMIPFKRKAAGFYVRSLPVQTNGDCVIRGVYVCRTYL